MKQKSIAELQKEIHLNAIDKGFYSEKRKDKTVDSLLYFEGERPLPEILCLIHSEVSEALEAYRKGLSPTNFANFAEEMADIVIRVMDLCEYLNINLYEEIIKKHKYNKTRPHKHGKKC